MNIASTFQLVLAIVGLQCAASLIVVNEFPSTQHLAQKQAIVVVRTYRPQLEMIEPFCRRLLNGSSSEVDIRFLLLPTESQDLGLFKDVATNLSRSGFDIQVPPFLSPEFYIRAHRDNTKCSLALDDPMAIPLFSRGVCLPPYDCSSQNEEDMFNKDLASHKRPEKLERTHKVICAYENQAHYWLVDRTIDYAMLLTAGSSNDTKTSLLITNADNIYREAFLAKLMASPQPIAISDFHERGSSENCRASEVRIKKIDLGTFIVDIEVLRKHNTRFLTNIPSFANDTHRIAQMRAYHDADWWFIRELVKEQKVPFTIVHECLFMHMYKRRSSAGDPLSWVRAPDVP